MKFRLQSDGSVKSQGEIRKLHTNKSIPKVWTKEVCEDLEIDPILESPKPAVTNIEQVVATEPVQDDKGNWMEGWKVVSRFNSEEEQEAFFAAELESKGKLIRTRRDKLLTETDWVIIRNAENNTAIPADVIEYRQGLRDLPSHVNFPNLEEADWPVKPEVQ